MPKSFWIHRHKQQTGGRIFSTVQVTHDVPCERRAVVVLTLRGSVLLAFVSSSPWLVLIIFDGPSSG